MDQDAWRKINFVVLISLTLSCVATAQTFKEVCVPAQEKQLAVSSESEAKVEATKSPVPKTDQVKPFKLSVFDETKANRQVNLQFWKTPFDAASVNETTVVNKSLPQATRGDDAAELAKKLSNPVASLIAFPLQHNFDFGMGSGSGWRYTLNIQPVVPIALNPRWNMISRTIFPVMHQGNVTGPNESQSGLGDIVQSIFFSPNKTEPLIWGLGPAVLVPIATNDAVGS
jgi:hypothetical protein